MKNLDYNHLYTAVVPNTKRISYEENKQYFHKVAFDVFQLDNSPTESYWILEKGDDGKEYLSACYEEPATLQTESNWQTLSDKKANNITVLYKNTPIYRCAAQDFGFDASDIHIFKSALINALNDQDNVHKMLNTLPAQKRADLYHKFPELETKHIGG